MKGTSAETSENRFRTGTGNFTRQDLEVAKGLLEDAGARAYDVDGAKCRLGGLHGGGELRPGRHVTFLEHGARTVGVRSCVVGRGELGLRGGDEVLGFRAQAEVGDEDVAALGDEGFGEVEADSLSGELLGGRGVAVWRG
jgi:hypothetical protein